MRDYSVPQDPEGRRPPQGRPASPLGRPAPQGGAEARYSQRRPQRDEIPRAQEEGTAMGGARLVERILKDHPERVHRVMLKKDSGEPWLYDLQKLAEKNRIQVQQVEWAVLDSYANPNHGAVAILHARELSDWTEVRTKLLKTPNTVVVLAGLEDPHNFGACARSALALGVSTILLPSKGTVGMTPAALRAGAGALELLDVAKPPVLEAAVEELVKNGYQVVGLDGKGTPLHEMTFTDKLVIVLGGEDKGIPPYLRKSCSGMARLPMSGSAHSFNASVALSLSLYEVARQRGFSGLQV